jgi:hypothetical protein
MLGKRWPRRGFFTEETDRPLAANVGVTLTAGTPAHTLSSSFTALWSATSAGVYKFRFSIYNNATSATNTSALVNIYVGGAGSEVLWIPTLLAGWAAGQGDEGGPKVYEFPLFVPAGTRISAKSQSIIASATVNVLLDASTSDSVLGSGWYGTGVECLGASAATSLGTEVVPGTSAEGTWTDIGTTTKRYGYIQPMHQGTIGSTVNSPTYFSLDIGASSAALHGLSGFLSTQNTTEEVFNLPQSFGRHTYIPAGTLLQARLQSSGTSVLGRDICLYGVY